ncbi:LacI family transcriptional regulator [Olsenella sp. TM06-36]|uniref:LacI family DNA-binding transcriptional regulator n=2 Tax=Olsenella TaxID=133925 RepID=UPI000E4479F2|nr:LacI family transcriptional regulator [Olsenella sp. TM06-36]RHJ92819.1 LacI family transcriptional regulator [Olsenella sp. AM05-7]RHJ97851.1 LacI family transcriptional regulator [Olsenella sp. AM05-17]
MADVPPPLWGEMRDHRRATSRDIADKVGLSVSAVSQTLNGKDIRLSQENKLLIRATAKRMNYQASFVAGSLATHRSYAYGLVVPDIENPFFSALAKALEEKSRESVNILVILNSNDCPGIDVDLFNMLAGRQVDGVFLIPSNRSGKETGRESRNRLITIVEQSTFPVVFIDRVPQASRCDSVSFDNVRGGYLATEQFIRRGHRRIVCLANEASESGAGRLKGYIEALSDYDIECRAEYIISCDYLEDEGYRAGEEVLRLLRTEKDERITAVLSCSDLATLGLLGCLHENGISVGDKCSVISYDNSPMIRFASPGITSVSQNVKCLAEQAFALMETRITRPDSQVTRVVLSLMIVERESVAVLAGV